MSKYFRELTLNLQHAGFVVKPETDDGLLPAEVRTATLPPSGTLPPAQASSPAVPFLIKSS